MRDCVIPACLVTIGSLGVGVGSGGGGFPCGLIGAAATGGGTVTGFS